MNTGRTSVAFGKSRIKEGSVRQPKVPRGVNIISSCWEKGGQYEIDLVAVKDLRAVNGPGYAAATRIVRLPWHASYIKPKTTIPDTRE